MQQYRNYHIPEVKHYAVDPRYKEHVLLYPRVHYTVNPRYKEHVPLYLVSLQGTRYTCIHGYITRWTLATRNMFPCIHGYITRWTLATRNTFSCIHGYITRWTLATRNMFPCIHGYIKQSRPERGSQSCSC